ncbi:hypothetical protein EBN03_24840 [Nocardia stercoris]|uniref:Uncharacterized protein n=1 Tax=Nocardia stercoris TaxID=2483361 RepID=A0A3M2L535_9NOCA|nr:hypothetical protein EBN03_24840 [Nocardia stercoris]
MAATPASAALGIVASTAYCAGSTYTVTVPAADAAAMATAAGASSFELLTQSTPSGSTAQSTPVTYTAGQDVSFQWTAPAAGTVNLYVMPVSANGAGGEGPLAVTVVQPDASGTGCVPGAAATTTVTPTSTAAVPTTSAPTPASSGSGILGSSTGSGLINSLVYAFGAVLNVGSSASSTGSGR